MYVPKLCVFCGLIAYKYFTDFVKISVLIGLLSHSAFQMQTSGKSDKKIGVLRLTWEHDIGAWSDGGGDVTDVLRGGGLP